MPETPPRSPDQDLAEALGTLERLAEKHLPPRSGAMKRAMFFLDTLEAEIDFGIHPDRMIQVDKRKKFK